MHFSTRKIAFRTEGTCRTNDGLIRVGQEFIGPCGISESVEIGTLDHHLTGVPENEFAALTGLSICMHEQIAVGLKVQAPHLQVMHPGQCHMLPFADHRSIEEALLYIGPGDQQYIEQSV